MKIYLNIKQISSVRVFFSLFCIILFFSSSEGMSQPRRMGMDPDEQVKRLNERLSFTDEQLPKVKEIFVAFNEEMQKARENSDGDRMAMFDTMMALRDETDKKLEAILTEEQKKEYQKIRKEREERRRQRRRNF